MKPKTRLLCFKSYLPRIVFMSVLGVTCILLCLSCTDTEEIPIDSVQLPSSHHEGVTTGQILGDNPTCEDLFNMDLIGPNWVEFKVEDHQLSIDPLMEEGSVHTSSDGFFSVEIVTDGTYFNWSSETGVDAVLSKGGNGANYWIYDPEALFGEGLFSPNNSSGGPAEISHITFCFDYNVDVSKTAIPEFTRDYMWTIDKHTEKHELLLAVGEWYNIEYFVDVGRGFMDKDWAITGTITIENNTPFTAHLSHLVDTMNGMEVIPDCDPPLPVELASTDSMECTYEVTFSEEPDVIPYVNHVNVFAKPCSMVGGDSAEATAVFGDPTTELHKCAMVTDTHAGVLAESVCQAETFSYEVRVMGGDCGDIEIIENTATLTSDELVIEDSETVIVHTADCEEGCTLTQGYWKTHSAYGPAPYDDTWALLEPDEEDTAFFSSGYSYYQILWMPPKKGDIYLILGKQYIAAVMNRLNGASAPPEVMMALHDATELYENELADWYPGKKYPKNVKMEVLEQHLILTQYNEGMLGPGHCDENHLNHQEE